MRKLNKFWIGASIGVILPFLFLYVFYIALDIPSDFSEFISISASNDYLWTVLKLAILSNLIPFLLGLQQNLMKFGRGVIAATFLYAGIIVYFTYIG